MSAKANEDVGHPLYMEQMKRIIQLTKTHDLKSSDLDLCVHWFEAFSTCGKKEKLARQSLADILYRQLNYKGYLSSPFTDVENCQRNLNELLREYEEQRGRQRRRSDEELLVRLDTPQPSAPPPSCISLAASRASREDVEVTTRQSNRQENRYPAGQTTDIQKITKDKSKKVAEFEWKAQFRTMPNKESEGRNTLRDKHTPGWLEQKNRTAKSPGRAERDQADLDEKLLQIYEREQKNRILAEKREAERKRKQEERKRLQQIEKDLLEAKRREMEKQREYQEERVRLQREWERNSVQKRALLYKHREHSPRKAEEQIKISPKRSPRERNDVKWIERETSTQRVSKQAINESKEGEQKQKEELQTTAEPENGVHRSIERLDALRRKMARTINEESASEEEKRKMELRKKMSNLELETNIEIERSAIIVARLEIEKKERQRKQQAETERKFREIEAYQKMYEKRTRQRQEEQYQEILKREQEETRQVEEDLQQRLRRQESRTKLVDEKYKELRLEIELHKRREEQRSQERLEREQEKARQIELELQLRLLQQESRTKLVGGKCVEFQEERELYGRQKEQRARKWEKLRSASSETSERAPGGRHCSALQPDLALSQSSTGHGQAQESSDDGMQRKKSNRSVRFNLTPMFSDDVDTKMSMYSQSSKDNEAKVTDPYVAEHVQERRRQATAEEEHKQADWKYADSIKEHLMERLNKQRTDNRIIIQKMQTFEEEEEEALETNSRSSKKRKDIENYQMEYMQHNTQQQHSGAKQDVEYMGYHEQSSAAEQPNESSSSCEYGEDPKLTLVGKYCPKQNVYIMQELGASKRRRSNAPAAKFSSNRFQAGGVEATKTAYNEREQYNAHLHQYIAELENKLQLCQRVSCPVEQSTQTMSSDQEFLGVVDELMELNDYQNKLLQRQQSGQQRTDTRMTAVFAAAQVSTKSLARNCEDSFEHYHAQVRQCLAQLESKLQLRHEFKNKPEQSVPSSSNDKDFQRIIEQLKELYDYRKNWLRRMPQHAEQQTRESAGQAEPADNVCQHYLMEKALHQDLSAAEQQLLFERIYQSLPVGCTDSVEAIKHLKSESERYDRELSKRHNLNSCADSALTKQNLDTDAAVEDLISQTTSYWSAECICACPSMGGCGQPLYAQPRLQCCQLELPAAALPCRVFGSLIEPLVRICGGEFPPNTDAQLRVEIEELDEQLDKHLDELFKRKFVESYKDKLLERATRLQRQLRHEENVLRVSTCYNNFLAENKNKKSISQCCFALLREMLEKHNDLEGNLSMRLLMQKIEQLFMKLTNV